MKRSAYQLNASQPPHSAPCKRARCNHVGYSRESKTMNLFSSDLYRNFGLGFLAGSVIVAAANGTEIVSAIVAIIR